MTFLREFSRVAKGVGFAFLGLAALVSPATATTFTTSVPGTTLELPADYPEAGGVAIVMVGANGNSYFQFSNPDGAFYGFNSNGRPTRFRGNPFTINDPISLDCGFSTCETYFGGSIANIYIRFSAYDGDTSPGNFDEDEITLRLNGFDVGNWSDVTTEQTNNSGTQSFGFQQGFGNRTFDTGWFQSSNSALLGNILTTGQTTTQVFDDSPDDNYWDFRRGSSLTNADIVTVAPGYTLTKTADKTDFLVVGETIAYEYIVTNIGSVPIRQLTVTDDKISNVSCNKTVINDTNPGGTADFATCTGSYEVSQEDVDNGQVTNIAQANGVPDFGTLGALQATLQVDGPAADPILRFEKTTTASTFGAVNSQVPYTFTVFNDGNVTLSDVDVSDSNIPGLTCVIADILPDQSGSCSGNYSVQQQDLDNFAFTGEQLTNEATVTVKDPSGTELSKDASVSLDGEAPDVDLSVEKTATTASFDAVDDVLQYQIKITNTGTVTFPSAPTVTDVITGGATCPSGAIAPGAFITCLANYSVIQSDIDLGKVDNTASASITIGSETATDEDDATVTADRTTGLTLVKRLASASPTSFADIDVDLTYEYELTNTGNVTLITPTVADNKVTVSCAATEIAPMTSIVCTSTVHTTDQADLNVGKVTNIATANAKDKNTGIDVPSDAKTLDVPAIQTPKMTLVKTATPIAPADFTPGNKITYTFEVTNSGNVDLTAALTGAAAVSIEDDKIGGSFTCFDLPLLRGETASCIGEYTISNTDFTAGTVANKAAAISGTVASNEANEVVSPDLMPAISLEKTASPTVISETTDTITYTFKVTNDGNADIVKTLQPITINDAKLTAVDCSSQPDVLAPMEFFECSADYTATLTEMNDAKVENVATASFTFENGGVSVPITSDPAEALVTVMQEPSFTFTKVGDPVLFTSENQDIEYTFTLTNTGNVTLTNVTVSDPLIPNLSCVISDLEPTQQQTCAGTYKTDQADVDAGVVDNEATAVGQTKAGGSVEEKATDTTPIDPSVIDKSVSIAKNPNVTEFANVGDTIVYSIPVTNNGPQTLTNITVTDVLDPTYSCLIPTLDGFETSNLCMFSYTVDQDDIDAGKVDNTASADGADIDKVDVSQSVTGPTRTAIYDFTKTASGDFTAKDEEITFTLAVTNRGTVTLTDVKIIDAKLTPSTCIIPSILPGVEDTSCVGIYTIQQSDVDAGTFTNTASVTEVGTPVGVTEPAGKDAIEVIDGPDERAEVAITKASTDGAFGDLPDTEVYTFEVTNTGNVTLTDLTVEDVDLSFSCDLDDLAPGASTTTCETGSPALSATKTFSQVDINQGSYNNTVTVVGKSLVKGTDVDASANETVTGPVQDPTIELVKSQNPAGATFDTLDQEVDYTFVVTNTGNITLTWPINVSDDKIDTLSCETFPVAGIAPLGTYTCTGTYEVTQVDLDTGFVTNLGTATMEQPVVPENAGDPAFKTVSDTDDETVNAAQAMELTLLKRIKSGSATSFSKIGDKVTFEYEVTNSGNVTTTSPITVTDDKIAGTLTCSTAFIAPLSSVTCEQVWTATQPDLDAIAGSITNTAEAATLYKGVSETSNEAQATITSVQTPQLTLDKQTITPLPDNFDDGEVLNYRFIVTNSGLISVSGPITIDDSITVATCVQPADGVLSPGESAECTASYTIGTGDVELGSTVNVATASAVFKTTDGAGAPVDQVVVSNSDSEKFPVGTAFPPALSLVKETVPAGVTFDDLTDTITYRYTVTNSGKVGLAEDIIIKDDKFAGDLKCFPTGDTSPGTITIFGVGDVAICEQTFDITQVELDDTFVTNVATANTVFALGTADETVVSSPSQSVTVNSVKNASLVVAKTVTSGDSPAVLNSEIFYQITTTNDGNQTISGVAVSDPLIPVLECRLDGDVVSGNVVLAPTEALICKGSYIVKQSDLDDQSQTDATDHFLKNTATARGSDPQGVTEEAFDENSHPLETPKPEIELTKTVIPEPGPDDVFSLVGQEVVFRLTAKNTGNISLSNVSVTDDLTVVPQGCPLDDLAPGDEDFCDVVYTVTQDDLDNTGGTDTGIDFSSFTNTADVTATAANPDSSPVIDDAEYFAKGPDQEPVFNLTKEADLDEITTFGQKITYTFVVANTGNITLYAQPVITDDKIGEFDCGVIDPDDGLPPLEFVTCTAEYFVKQEDLDNGGVTNIATVASTEVPLPTDPAAARATETVDAVRTTGIALTKVASPVDAVKAGQIITYTYTAKNTGNVTLENVELKDTQTSSSGETEVSFEADALSIDVNETGTSLDSDGTGVWTTLAPGDVVTFTSKYTVTQKDVDEQVTLSNTASLTSQDANGTETPSDEKTVEIDVEAKDPKFTVTKTADASDLNDPAQLGDTISFEIKVTNTGNQTLDGVVLDDDFTDALGNELTLDGPTAPTGDTVNSGDLDVGEVWTYTASFDLNQQAIDVGGVENNLSVKVEDPQGEEIEVEIDTPIEVPIAQDADMSVVKTAVLNDGGDGRADKDDTITYTYTIRNEGNTTLYDLGVSETSFSGSGTTPVPLYDAGGADIDGEGDAIDLAFGTDVVTFKVTYTLTQDDLDAGKVDNQATATSKDPAGDDVSDLSDPTDPDGDGTTTVPFGQENGLVVLKTATPNLSSPVKIGDTIDFEITLNNTGNISLDTPDLTDTLLDADNEGLTIAEPTYDRGDSDGDDDLDPGETWIYKVTFTLDQQAIDTGGVSNSVLVETKDVNNVDVSDTSDPSDTTGNNPTVVTLPTDPKVGVVKSAVINDGGDGRIDEDDTITYTYTVSNLGNVTLFDVTVSEDTFTGTGTEPAPARTSGGAQLGGDATAFDLAVGAATMVFEATYELTQADIDAGKVDNQALVVADDPEGDPFDDLSGNTTPGEGDDTTTSTPITRTPSLEITKQADVSSLSSPVKKDDTITFNITLENTGNVTLDTVELDDDFTRKDGAELTLDPGTPTGDAGVAGDLEVGETWTYQVVYALTQEDIDAGGVSNTITATAKDPTGADVEDVSDNGQDTDGNSEDDPTVIDIQGVPNLSIVKALKAGQPDPFDTLGQTLIYQFTVTNDSNITITAPVEITDALITDAGNLITCEPSPIAPGASITCEGPYKVTQTDLDAGKIDNSATATVEQPVVPVNVGDPSVVSDTSDPDVESVDADQKMELSVVKTIISPVSTYDETTDEIIFEYTITNTGNVTTTEDITLTDDKIPSAPLVCSTAPLAPISFDPDAKVTCQLTWKSSQQALNDGEVTNTAIASTDFKGTSYPSEGAKATITAVQTKKLTMVKTLTLANPDLFDEETILSYKFVVTNEGNVTVDGPITINDSIIDAGDITCPVLPDNELLPDGIYECTGTYEIGSGDLKLGSTTNVASATGSFDGDPVISNSDSQKYPVGDAFPPALSIAKTSDPVDVTFENGTSTIKYVYTISNTGGAGFTEDIFVTDSKIVDTDGNPEPFLCRADTLGTFSVGDTYECSVIYTVTQDDLDAGTITNEASASTVFAPDGPDETPVASPAVEYTVTGVEDPVLGVAKTITGLDDKDSDGDGNASVGDVVSYQIVVSNDGNQTLSGVNLTDPSLADLTCLVDGLTAPDNVVLLPSEQMICTGTYEIDQDDIDAGTGTYVNTASATASKPDGTSITKDGQATQSLDVNTASLEVLKTILPDPATAPAFTGPEQTIRFVLTAHNNGNTTLTSITLSDERDVLPTSCIVGPLAPGERDSSCVVEYKTTQTDVNESGFTNVAKGSAISANDPTGDPVLDTGEVFVKGPDRAPEFALSKGADVSDVSKAGDTIVYTYVVTNAGNVTLVDQPAVTDDKIIAPNVVTCQAIPDAGLDPGETLSCEATYIVTQADMNAGTIINIATVASDEVPLPTDPGDARATETVDAPRTPSLVFDKSIKDKSLDEVGDIVEYIYRVTNDGNVTLSDVTIGDQHTSASGTDALTIAGETLVSDITPTSDSTDAADNGVWDTLEPGDQVTFTSSYTITQDDVDTQTVISNTATVTTSSPDGTTPPTDTDTETLSPEDPNPEVTALKTFDASTLSTPPIAGETINFTITLTNSGNQTLDNIRLSDTFRRADGEALSLDDDPELQTGDAGVVGDMEVGEVWTYSAAYELKQSDIDAGGVNNSVLVKADSPDGTEVSDVSDDNTPADGDDDPTVIAVAQTASIEGAKSITSSVTAVDEIVTFEITVTNTGNVTLTDVTVVDSLTRANGDDLDLTTGPSFQTATLMSGAGNLLPNETATYAATYKLTQDDINAGGIENTATVSGLPPVGGPISDKTDSNNPADGTGEDDPTVLTIDADPAISIAKSLVVATEAPNTFATLDQVLRFKFVITNTGTVTLDQEVTITDAIIQDQGTVISCPIETLDPGDTLDCFADYTVTQDDLDAGEVINTASATVPYDGIDVPTDDDAVAVVDGVQTKSLTIVKTLTSAAPDVFDEDTRLDYQFVVTNNGNVTIDGPITINDGLLDPTNISCEALTDNQLLPDGELICTGFYVLNADNIKLGSTTNVASATGTFDGVDVTSPTDDAIYPVGADPALTLTKDSVPSDITFAKAGDEITYTFAISNTGKAGFTEDVIITDNRFLDPTTGEPEPFVCHAATDGIFGVGAVKTCAAPRAYEITQDDMDAGQVINEAAASSVFAKGTENEFTASSPAVTKTVPAATDPKLSIEKEVIDSTNDPIGEGDTITYRITVTNSGNQTISGVSASDAMLADLTCTVDSGVAPANVILAPQDQLICTGTYKVLQSDVDTGSVTNEASVTGSTPSGNPVDKKVEIETELEDADPKMTLLKVATPDPFGAVGTNLTYNFTVKNTGNVTLFDVKVGDAMATDFPCVIGELAPLAEDTSCGFTIEITQDHVDAGSIINNATLDAKDPKDDPLEQVKVEIETDGPDRVAGIEATKTVMPTAGVIGAKVKYVLQVANTGNVSVTLQDPVDTMERLNNDGTQLDAPFELILSSDTDGDGKLDVDEVWTYEAEYTLTQRDLNAGGLSNSVTIDGTGEGGDPASDTSDDGIDGDTSDTDDATVFEIPTEPALDVTKVVESSEGLKAGDDVVFFITATNIGNVDLTDLSISDTLRRANSVPVRMQPDAVIVSVPPTLSPGGEATWRVTYELEQADVDAGGLTNTATVSSKDPDDNDVSDVSNNDDPTDGNLTDDPTTFDISPTPSMTVLKTLTSIGSSVDAPNNQAVFKITVFNDGNVTLSGVTITEDMTNSDGASVGPVTTTFVETDATPQSVEGILKVGETATYEATYTLKQADIDSGGVQNTATASAKTPLGGSFQDASDDDGVNPSDPTDADIPSSPTLNVVKTSSLPRVLFPTIEEITFTITVKNTGNVTQTNMQVVDNLTNYVAPGTLLSVDYPPVLSVADFGAGSANAAFDGVTDTNALSGNATLAPGETGTITVTSTYSTLSGRPNALNVASATSDQLLIPSTGEVLVNGGDKDGDGVPDSLESDTNDRDGDGIPDNEDYDPTGYFYCEENGRIIPGGQISVSGSGFTQTGVGTSGPIVIVQDGSNGYFQFHTTAAGTFTMGLTYPPSGQPSTTRLTSGNLVGATLLPANPASLGSNENGSTGILADFSAGANTPFYTSFTVAAGDPIIINNNFPLRNCVDNPSILATKTSDRSTAVFGETVNFTLGFRNDTTTTYPNARLVDLLPAGMLYTPGSARLNGAAVEPSVTGRRLVWGGLNITPASTWTITLSARVVGGGTYGTIVNQAFMEDQNGVRQSNTATASVRIEPEHVFDCSDVIGKVFDDKNLNGYQDGPSTLPTEITNQEIFDSKLGKFAAPPKVINTDEPGLAGVRLVTPDGTIITTDEFGRYNVPCAALPENIGTNFTLKLDTRTLPTGYRVTTENPRVERLTAGKFVKMNFGAALASVINVDLTAQAFVQGTKPVAAFDAAVGGLINQVKAKPSILRLTYLMQQGEDRATATARLRAIEQVIRRAWRGQGPYSLVIEKTVKRVQ